MILLPDCRAADDMVAIDAQSLRVLVRVVVKAMEVTFEQSREFWTVSQVITLARDSLMDPDHNEQADIQSTVKLCTEFVLDTHYTMMPQHLSLYHLHNGIVIINSRQGSHEMEGRPGFGKTARWGLAPSDRSLGAPVRTDGHHLLTHAFPPSRPRRRSAEPVQKTLGKAGILQKKSNALALASTPCICICIRCPTLSWPCHPPAKVGTNIQM